MQKIIVLFTVATFIAASVRLAQAQQAMKVHRIGYLHGRNAGYPAPPVQTPACSFSAPGSSVLLASAQDLAIKQTLSVAVSR